MKNNADYVKEKIHLLRFLVKSDGINMVKYEMLRKLIVDIVVQ